jgi:hypothetical protein
MTGALDGFPKTLRIDHLKYTFKAVAKGSLDDSYGQMDSVSQLIQVETGHGAARTREVVLHEILHALWSSRNLGEQADEEAVVTGLARGLTSVMADNPRLRAWFAREFC